MFKRILPLCLLGLSLAAQPATHEGHPGGPFGGPGAFLAPLKALGLSEAQRTAIHEVLGSHKEAMKAKTDAAHAAHLALMDAAALPETTEAQLKTLHETAAAAHFEVLKEGRTLHQEIDPILTPEQRAKARELKGKFRSHMEGLRQFAFGN